MIICPRCGHEADDHDSRGNYGCLADSPHMIAGDGAPAECSCRLSSEQVMDALDVLP